MRRVEMKKIREFLENETIRNFLTILKVFLIDRKSVV